MKTNFSNILTFKRLLTTSRHHHQLCCLHQRDVFIESHWRRMSTTAVPADRLSDLKEKISSGPSFEQFISGLPVKDKNVYTKKRGETHPYLDPSLLNGNGRKVYFETYGCQMNVNDTEIAASILKDHGYVIVSSDREANIIFLMTCAIREGAEKKIWGRLKELKLEKKVRTGPNKDRPQLQQIGLLGCVAERLKGSLLEKEKLLDIIAGPDAYRDLPKLLAINQHGGMHAVNVLLSLDETYADVMPVVKSGQVSTFISIMRGCDNMCSYCIVPFTRGRERSRPIDSIVNEVKHVTEAGIKEITLLGQNVNSYRDKSVPDVDSPPTTVSGFKTIYKDKTGGLTFDVLLEEVARVNPEVRIRFTSPHPKDFPDRVLEVIKKYKNICKSIHLPAQSGSNAVLERMRRGYTREAYLDLVSRIRDLIPNVSLSSDFISGFCGETEEDHQQTLDLIGRVKYNFLYMFAYSMRDKTHASHHYKDDVPQEVKTARVADLNQLFRKYSTEINNKIIGTKQIILIEGESKRSPDDFVGRTDGNTRVIVPRSKVMDKRTGQKLLPNPGDYLAVEVLSATSQSLKGRPLYVTTLQEE